MDTKWRESLLRPYPSWKTRSANRTRCFPVEQGTMIWRALVFFGIYDGFLVRRLPRRQGPGGFGEYTRKSLCSAARSCSVGP